MPTTGGGGGSGSGISQAQGDVRYQQLVEEDQPDGYAGLDEIGRIPAVVIGVGNEAGTILVAPDDSEDSRADWLSPANAGLEETANKNNPDGYVGLNDQGFVGLNYLTAGLPPEVGSVLTSVSTDPDDGLQFVDPAAFEHTANKDNPDGYAGLDGDGLVPPDQLGANPGSNDKILVQKNGQDASEWTAVLPASVEPEAGSPIELATNKGQPDGYAPLDGDGNLGAPLADAAINIDQLQTGSVGPDQLTGNAVTADKIEAGAVTLVKLAADARTAMVVVEMAEPADGTLAATEIRFWYEDTVGAPVFHIKAKDASGDVFTGAFPLVAA